LLLLLSTTTPPLVGSAHESIDFVMLSHVLGLEIDRPLTSKSLLTVLSMVFFDLPLPFY
jgi:hypothetical protein